MKLFNRGNVLFLRSRHMGVGGGAARNSRRRGVRGSSETNQNRVAPVAGSMRAMTVLEVLGGRGRGRAVSFQELLSVFEFSFVVSTIEDCVLAMKVLGMGVGVSVRDWSWRGRGGRGWEVVWRGVVVGDDGAGVVFSGSRGEGQ